MPDSYDPHTRLTRPLGRAEWIEAAWELLQKGGVESVKVVPLSRRLGVTKGSFYWHFRDRDDLLQALLEEWEARSTQRFIEQVEVQDAPVRKSLETLLEAVVAARNPEVDQAFREWAKTDPRAADLVRTIDRRRLDFLTGLVCQLGFPEDEARLRVEVLYFWSVGELCAGVTPRDPAEQVRRGLRVLSLVLGG